MATRTAPITKQFAVAGTPVHLGAQITEEGRFRITVPLTAGSSVWIGKAGVAPSDGGEYCAGSSVQLPSSSMNGWYAVTDGTSVTVTLECATGGADAPDWADAGTTSAGSSGGGGAVTQSTGSGTEAGFWTVRLSNGTSFLPFPTTLDDGRFATASVLTNGTNDVVVTNAVPGASDYGLVSRVVGLPAAATWTDGQAQFSSTRIWAGLVGINPGAWGGAGTMSAPACDARGLSVQGYVSADAVHSTERPVQIGLSDGTNVRRLRGDATGRPRIMLAGAAPHADATTDVYTRFPTLGTAYTAFTSGVASLKGTAGRIRQLHIHYDGATGSGLYVQLHNAATATTPTDNTWVMSWPINATNSVIDFLSQIDIPCSAGIKLAFSTTRFTYTAATTETGGVVGWGA